MSYEVPIERGKIAEFARATQAGRHEYFEHAAVVPPTFLTIARNFYEPELETLVRGIGFDLARVLHGEEEFVFHCRPPRAGTSVWAQSRLDTIWEKPGKRGGSMRFARLLTEFLDDAGTVIAEQRTTLIETAQSPTESAR